MSKTVPAMAYRPRHHEARVRKAIRDVFPGATVQSTKEGLEFGWGRKLHYGYSKIQAHLKEDKILAYWWRIPKGKGWEAKERHYFSVDSFVGWLSFVRHQALAGTVKALSAYFNPQAYMDVRPPPFVQQAHELLFDLCHLSLQEAVDLISFHPPAQWGWRLISSRHVYQSYIVNLPGPAGSGLYITYIGGVGTNHEPWEGLMKTRIYHPKRLEIDRTFTVPVLTSALDVEVAQHQAEKMFIRESFQILNHCLPTIPTS